MKKYTKKFVFLCSEEIYQELKSLAKKEKSSMGWVIRRLIHKTYVETSQSLHVDKTNRNVGGLR